MNGLRWMILALVVLSGCGESVGKDGDVVGRSCDNGDDCAAGSVCEDSGDFPNGTCTVECERQADCPSGSTCVDKSSGLCLLDCDDADDCRNGYGCEEKSVKDDGGKAKVCID